MSPQPRGAPRVHPQEEADAPIDLAGCQSTWEPPPVQVVPARCLAAARFPSFCRALDALCKRSVSQRSSALAVTLVLSPAA